MRSFSNRTDTVVVDEPLYAHYLLRTGRHHPGAADVITHHEGDWRVIVKHLSEAAPDGKAVFYQKHMAHHLLPHVDRDWLSKVTNAFLIRDPALVLKSLVKQLEDADLADTGLPQQVEIFRRMQGETGKTPAVVDAHDLLADPPGMLSALCAALGIPFEERMLSWPPGPRPEDGVWAPHWYQNVWKSTGFTPLESSSEPLPAHLEPLLERCRPFYEELHAHRLQVGVAQGV